MHETLLDEPWMIEWFGFDFRSKLKIEICEFLNVPIFLWKTRCHFKLSNDQHHPEWFWGKCDNTVRSVIREMVIYFIVFAEGLLRD